MAELPDGTLVLAACRDNYKKDRAKRGFSIEVYESSAEGLTWTEIGESPLFGKEPSLTALPDGSLVLTAQDYGPGATHDRIPISRSSDGGRTWQTIELMGPDYPRNMIVEPDGSLLFVRAIEWDWKETTATPTFSFAAPRTAATPGPARRVRWTGMSPPSARSQRFVSRTEDIWPRYARSLPMSPPADAPRFRSHSSHRVDRRGRALVEAPADHVYRRGARLPDRNSTTGGYWSPTPRTICRSAFSQW